jgi:hypothetical protein
MQSGKERVRNVEVPYCFNAIIQVGTGANPKTYLRVGAAACYSPKDMCQSPLQPEGRHRLY